jgi:hypothetical protein
MRQCISRRYASVLGITSAFQYHFMVHAAGGTAGNIRNEPESSQHGTQRLKIQIEK